MSSFNYDRVATIALTQISRFGGKVQLQRKASKTAEHATIAKSVAVMSSWMQLANQGFVGSAGSTPVTSDLAALLPGQIKKAPLVGDRLVFADKTYKIEKVEPINPSGGKCVLFIVGLV